MGCRFLKVYVVLAILAAASSVAAPGDHALGGALGSAGLEMWVLSTASAVCLALAGVLLYFSWRESLAELTILGTSFTIFGWLTLLAVLAAPGYLRSSPTLAFSAGAVALPAGLAAAAPILIRASGAGRLFGLRWKAWSAAWLAIAVAASVYSWWKNPAWLPSHGAAIYDPLEIAGVLATGVLVARHMRLYRIGHDPRSAIMAASLAFLAGSPLLAPAPAAGSTAWWASRALQLVSLAAATSSGISIARRQSRAAEFLSSVIRRDPLVALEVGLSPELHALVASLESTDICVRDHVLRVGELATRAAIRAGLPARGVRNAGLAALLHDIGKLIVPSQIERSSSGLSDAEFEELTTHSARGAALLRASTALTEVADLVRSHHEHYDATGYPDGIHGTEYPFEASLVSVCDAWDAMTNDRRYRNGIGDEHARQALLDGAGTQWHPEAVRIVLEEVSARDATSEFAIIGTAAAAAASRAGDSRPKSGETDSVCPDALPMINKPRHRRTDTRESVDDAIPLPRTDQLTELWRSQRRFKTAFEQAPIGMLIVDSHGKIQCSNSAFDSLLGLADPAAGTTAIDLVSASDRRTALRWVASLRRRPDYVYSCDLRLGGSGRSAVPVHVAGSVIEEEDHSISYLVHVVDVSERQRMELELRRQAFVDPLTGLLNRRGLLAAGPEVIRRNLSQGLKTTGVFIDIDGLKATNDTFGHERGDLAIIDVATVLAAMFPAGSLIARLGGDEMFVLTIDKVWDGEALGTALRRRLAEHASARGRPYHLSASAGTAVLQSDSDTIASLIDRSDNNLYQRRRNERGPGRLDQHSPSRLDERDDNRSPAMSAAHGAR